MLNRMGSSSRGGCRVLCLAALALVLGCGSSKPKQANSGDDFFPDDTGAESKAPEESTSAEVKQPEAPTEQAANTCEFKTEAPIKSQMGTVQIRSGCVSPQAVHDALRIYAADVQDCFKQERQGNPKAKGEVDIRLSFGKSGMRSVRVEKSEISTGEFVQCVIDSLKAANMPSPKEGVVTAQWVVEF